MSNRKPKPLLHIFGRAKIVLYRCITARTARMKRRGSTFDNNDNDFNIVNSNNNNVPSDDDSSFLTEKMQDNS